MTRKTLSVFTFGLIGFRSDKERTAADTKASKKQTKLMKQQLEMQKRLDG